MADSDSGNSENVSRAMSLLCEVAAVLAQDNSPSDTTPTTPRPKRVESQTNEKAQLT
jgi:hypothetical protein